MIVQKPYRVAHHYVQHIQAPAEEVFPLLCPVREVEWVDGWMPRAVYSFSGYAEADCIFTTPDGDGEALWVVTEYDPNHRVGFVKVTPGSVVTRITIVLSEHEDGGTAAEVSYTYTALSDEGRAVVEQMTKQAYERFMHTWETALNDYLLRQRDTTTAGGESLSNAS